MNRIQVLIDMVEVARNANGHPPLMLTAIKARLLKAGIPVTMVINGTIAVSRGNIFAERVNHGHDLHVEWQDFTPTRLAPDGGDASATHTQQPQVTEVSPTT